VTSLRAWPFYHAPECVTDKALAASGAVCAADVNRLHFRELVPCIVVGEVIDRRVAVRVVGVACDLVCGRRVAGIPCDARASGDNGFGEVVVNIVAERLAPIPRAAVVVQQAVPVIVTGLGALVPKLHVIELPVLKLSVMES
jgi:hypothetical protein